MSSQRRQSVFLPLIVLAAALLVWFVFQTTQLMRERHNLERAHANQENLVQNSQRLRAALDTLATETLKLANQGNPNARLLVEELRRRGVTINPPQPQAPPAPAK